MARLAPALAETLRQVAAAMAEAQEDWWIIASAAMALHGARPLTVGDVDLLASVADARRLLAGRGLVPVSDGTSPRFRSQLFGRWPGAPLPVEVMAGFEVRTAAGWQAVAPQTRLSVRLGPSTATSGATLFVPSVGELIAHCALFDRPKDRARAALLRALPG